MFRRAKQSALEQGLERAKQAQEAVAQRRWFEGFEHAATAAELLMAAMKDPANKTRVPQLRQSVNQMLQLAEDAKKGEAEAAACRMVRSCWRNTRPPSLPKRSPSVSSAADHSRSRSHCWALRRAAVMGEAPAC